jgi:putative ABC transport system permease protein
VFSWIAQTIAVTALNLKTIPQRLASSAVAIVGIAGVVVVLVSVLSIAQGFTAAMRDSGSPSRALVMRSGADSEMTSGLSGPEVDVVKQAPGMRRDGHAALASAELYVIIDLPKRSTNTSANVPMRGIEPTASSVREEISMIEGRMLQFGTNEVVVGRGASRQFIGLTLGNEIVSGQNRWTVVGIFEGDGGVAESEIWCDARVLQGAYRRGNTFQTVLARLDSSEAFDTFRDWLTANPQLNVQVRRETEYYAQQSRALSSLIRTIGFGIAALMGIGAVFGAVLTMYTAVSTRSRARVQYHVRRGLGAGRIACARRDRRRDRRRQRLSRIQRVSDLDHELSDVQSGGVRLPGHAWPADHGTGVRAGDGADRRPVAGRSRGAPAYPDGAERTLGESPIADW